MPDKIKQRLIDCYAGLDDERRKALLEYAEFLLDRSEPTAQALPEPDHIPRPQQESVVAAIKRLSASYHMLDKQYMLHEISGLMAQHMLHGRAAGEVIDEIELVFSRHYEQLASKAGDN